MTTTPDAILEVAVSQNEQDRNLEPANLVDGLFAIARSIENLSRAVHALGTNNAAGPMGAVELLAVEVKNGFELLSSSIGDISVAVDMMEDKNNG